jgi:hypothetical protein
MEKRKKEREREESEIEGVKSIQKRMERKWELQTKSFLSIIFSVQ